MLITPKRTEEAKVAWLQVQNYIIDRLNSEVRPKKVRQIRRAEVPQPQKPPAKLVKLLLRFFGDLEDSVDEPIVLPPFVTGPNPYDVITFSVGSMSVDSLGWSQHEELFDQALAIRKAKGVAKEVWESGVRKRIEWHVFGEPWDGAPKPQDDQRIVSVVEWFDQVAGKREQRGGRPRSREHLYEFILEQESRDPEMSDQQLANAYNRKHPPRKDKIKATAKIVRDTRSRYAKRSDAAPLNR